MLNNSLRGCYTAQPKASSNNCTKSVQLTLDASIYLRFAPFKDKDDCEAPST